MAIFKVVDLAVLVPAALLSAYLSARYSIGGKVIENLTTYVPTMESPEFAKEEKRKKRADVREERVDGSSLILIPTSQTTLRPLPHFSLVENLIYSTLLMVLVFFGYSVLQYLGLSTFGTPSLLLSGSVMLQAVIYMVKVSCTSKLASNDEKVYAAFFALLGFVGCVAYFALESRGSIFLWSPASAAEAAAALTRLLVQEAIKKANITTENVILSTVSPPSSAVGLIFAIIGGCLAGTLYAPSLRFARAFNLELNPPIWARERISKGVLSSIRLRLEMILPIALILLYIKPIVIDLLGFPLEWLGPLTSSALIITGVLCIMNTRILVSRYLDTTFITWYIMKHGHHKNKLEKIAAYSLVKAKGNAVRITLCKAAVLGLSLGVFYLACGLLNLGVHMYCIDVHQNGSAELHVYVRDLAQNIIGFAVCATGTTWLIIASSALWLLRTGTLPN